MQLNIQLYPVLHEEILTISLLSIKIAKKNSLNECAFVNSARTHVVKNTLLQIAFSMILPTGISFLIGKHNTFTLTQNFHDYVIIISIQDISNMILMSIIPLTMQLLLGYIQPCKQTTSPVTVSHL